MEDTNQASVQAARASSSRQGQEARARLFGSPVSTIDSEARQAESVSGTPSFLRDEYNTPSRIKLSDRETLHTLPSEGTYQRRSEQYEFSQFRPSVDSVGVRRSGDYEVGTYHSVQAHYRKVPSPNRYRENSRFSGEGEYVGSGERRGISPTGKAFARPLQAAVPPEQLLNNEYWENLTKSPYNKGRIQEIEKTVEAIEEVLVPVPVDKIVERVEENIVVVDRSKTEPVSQPQVEWQIEEITKEVPVETEVIEEVYQEEYVDKIVEKVVEVIKEIPVIKVVQRKVEVVREIPMVRYVDKIITKEIQEKRFVERVVEVIKEKPVEVEKQVPVYVMDKANSYVVQGNMVEGRVVQRDTQHGPESPAKVTVRTNVVTSEAYADVAPFIVKPEHIPLHSSQRTFQTHSPIPVMDLRSSYHGVGVPLDLRSTPVAAATPISLHSSMRELRDASLNVSSTVRYRGEPEPPIRDPMQLMSASSRVQPELVNASPSPAAFATHTMPPAGLVTQPAVLDTSSSRFASLLKEKPSPSPALRAAAPPAEEKRCGVGIVLQQEENGSFTVLNLVPGGAAEKSERVEAEDLLVTVDGNDVQGMGLEALVGTMEGAEKSLVRMLFARQTPQGRIHYSVTLGRTVPSKNQGTPASPSRRVQIQDARTELDPFAYA